MRIVFMGTPDFAIPSLQALLSSDHMVVGVFTQPDKPQGRKMILKAPPVKELALQYNLPVFQPESMKEQAALDELQRLEPDVIVVVAYGKILPQTVLDLPRYGCVNVHGSLLPRWRGAAPIQWAVIAGDKTTGVTTMQMNAGLDTGDMLLTLETPIGEHETAGELFDRLAQAGAELLLDTLRQMEDGSLTPRVQDDSQSCYASMLNKSMSVIDWTRPAQEIDCLIRGLNPWPVALTSLAGQRMKVFTARIEQGSGAPGAVLEVDAKKGLLVACGEGALRITELQMIGGKRMAAQEYLRGHAVTPGTALGRD